jgi:hypothetical protein
MPPLLLGRGGGIGGGIGGVMGAWWDCGQIIINVIARNGLVN